MNVTGITTPPAVPAPQVIPRVDSASHTETDPHHQAQAEHESKAKGKADEHAKRHTVEAPPIKPLSTTEVRVILGGLPPDVLLQAAKRPGKGHFDSYA